MLRGPVHKRGLCTARPLPPALGSPVSPKPDAAHRTSASEVSRRLRRFSEGLHFASLEGGVSGLLRCQGEDLGRVKGRPHPQQRGPTEPRPCCGPREALAACFRATAVWRPREGERALEESARLCRGRRPRPSVGFRQGFRVLTRGPFPEGGATPTPAPAARGGRPQTAVAKHGAPPSPSGGPRRWGKFHVLLGVTIRMLRDG